MGPSPTPKSGDFEYLRPPEITPMKVRAWCGHLSDRGPRTAERTEQNSKNPVDSVPYRIPAVYVRASKREVSD